MKNVVRINFKSGYSKALLKFHGRNYSAIRIGKISKYCNNDNLFFTLITRFKT